MKRIVVGVTGASGIPYARSLVRSLSGHPEVERLHLVISGYGYQAVREELKLTGGENECIEAITGGSSGKIVPHPPTDMTAPISSGSYPIDAMVVIPCSVGTVGALASGAGTHLVHRAAEVCLKEHRTLILAVRETPMHPGHLENLLKVARWGAQVFPICPAFYHHPKTIQDLIDQFNARILDHLGLPHRLGIRWKESETRT